MWTAPKVCNEREDPGPEHGHLALQSECSVCNLHVPYCRAGLVKVFLAQCGLPVGRARPDAVSLVPRASAVFGLVSARGRGRLLSLRSTVLYSLWLALGCFGVLCSHLSLYSTPLRNSSYSMCSHTRILRTHTRVVMVGEIAYPGLVPSGEIISCRRTNQNFRACPAGHAPLPAPR